MDAIFAEYLERLNRRHRSPKTVRQADYAFRTFEAAIGPDLLDPIAVEDVFADLPLAWGTRRNVLQHVRSAYLYALRRGRIPIDPTYDVDIGRRPERETRVLSNGELRSCLGAARSEDDMTKLLLLVYTGMRRHEIAQLQWKDVNLMRARLTVLGKGGKLRHVPVHPALGEALAPRWRGGPDPVVRWVHWDWLEGMAGPGVGFHTFRRTLATSLRRNGVQPSVIDRIFGWAPRGMLDRYYNAVDEREMAEAILRAYAEDPL